MRWSWTLPSAENGKSLAFSEERATDFSRLIFSISELTVLSPSIAKSDAELGNPTESEKRVISENDHRHPRH